MPIIFPTSVNSLGQEKQRKICTTMSGTYFNTPTNSMLFHHLLVITVYFRKSLKLFLKIAIWLLCLDLSGMSYMQCFCLAVSNNNQHSKNVRVFVFNFHLPNTNCHHPVACSSIQSIIAFGLTTVCLSDINLAMDLANKHACFSECLKGS